MIRVRGRCVGGRIELESPVPLTDGTPVEVVVQPIPDDPDDWADAAAERLEREWDNDRDAVYDDWKRLYGQPG
jgi:hypothetical protein